VRRWLSMGHALLLERLGCLLRFVTLRIFERGMLGQLLRQILQLRVVALSRSD